MTATVMLGATCAESTRRRRLSATTAKRAGTVWARAMEGRPSAATSASIRVEIGSRIAPLGEVSYRLLRKIQIPRLAALARDDRCDSGGPRLVWTGWGSNHRWTRRVLTSTTSSEDKAR